MKGRMANSRNCIFHSSEEDYCSENHREEPNDFNGTDRLPPNPLLNQECGCPCQDDSAHCEASKAKEKWFRGGSNTGAQRRHSIQRQSLLASFFVVLAFSAHSIGAQGNEAVPRALQSTNQPTGAPVTVGTSSPLSFPSALTSPDIGTATPSASRITTQPSTALLPSAQPSPAPSDFPTVFVSPSASFVPSDGPSFGPSDRPTGNPSPVPSLNPSISQAPSGGPSISRIPSSIPTDSPQPSPAPSSTPSKTPPPTRLPSSSSSYTPSMFSSAQPSSFPSFSEESSEIAFYFQRFTVDNGQLFNQEELALFESVFEGYTKNISGEVYRTVNSSCNVYKQQITQRRRLEDGQSTVLLVELPLNNVEYNISWTAMSVNVSEFPTSFRSFVNSNLEQVLLDLQAVGLNVSSVLALRNIVVTTTPTTSPSQSGIPSTMPSSLPSLWPSQFPTDSPSISPSSLPSLRPSRSPSALPSGQPSSASNMPTTTTEAPTDQPSSSPTQGEPSSAAVSPTIVAVLSVAMGAAVLTALFFFLRHRKYRKEQEFQTAAAANGPPSGRYGNHYDSNRPPRNRLIISTRDSHRRRDPSDTPKSDDNVVGIRSPSESLLSAGHSVGGDSVDEQDGTHHLADEFDQYKDQNLERMRKEVNEALSGADGMMSKAVFSAFIGIEEKSTDPNDVYWGGSGDADEIEASALCEVNDWLKRKDGASLEERRGFMQYSMNKMVASVREEFIKPEQAARTIHECAAMLSLELAATIPETTLLVTGMRKTVTKEDMKAAFREFGKIEKVAVSPNARGFGLVRFVSATSVRRAVDKYLKEEIVVQDVGVTVKVLSSGDTGRPVMAPWSSRAGESSQESRMRPNGER